MADEKGIMKDFDPMDPEVRRTYIGASDIPIIMGESPWKKPIELWEEKMGIREDQTDNFHTRRGRDYEPVARHKFESHIPGIYEPCFKRDSQVTWMAANLDGFDFTSNTLVEIKCPSLKTFEAMKEAGIIPLQYQMQMCWQKHISGANKCYFFAYQTETHETLLIEFEEPEGMYQTILDEAEYFWECVQSGTPPEGSERHYTKIENDELIELITELEELQEEKKRIENKITSMKKDLIDFCGQENARVGCFVVEKTYRKGAIDYLKIPELRSVDLEKYRKEPVVIWRVR